MSASAERPDRADGGLVELELPARPEVVSVARLVVGAVVAALPDFDDERGADVRLAVSEACTNAVQAQARGASGGGAEPPISLAVRSSHRRLEVEVVDHGGGFDPATLRPHPEVTDPARLDHEGGLGIPLLHMLADEVTFTAVPGGTRVGRVLRPRPPA